ncbi:PLP-dependent aminotransferase family protein [Pseudomonas oryzihabitans]|uniref:aminotransferase-like domain-containing protein n=1 Tax=Pseudomonas oryzihabitans TaxID=47885 RepID=UPI0028944E8E|nr:PLP-dependent aminotransferase family protein [Pseudomonas oryzihabitans]MDT3720978.1 PLP-dependent aminotransferase family protein [Pseudomonas oryzihabitans]
MAFSERVTRLKSSLIRDILAAAQRSEVMSFAGGLPAERCLPTVDWSAMPAGLGQYGMSEGEPALREAIAVQARAYGLDCTAEQVLVTTGSQQALDLIAKLYLDVDTPVLLEGPTYLAALQSFQFFGADCLSVSLTPEGLDLAALRDCLAARRPAFAYLIPTFQNPSGVRYSPANRAAVAALLDEFGVTLVEDEPYRELCYDGEPAQPLCARLQRSAWIYTGSLSKTLLPGLRVGYLIASPELLKPLRALKQAADLHTCRVSQWQVLQWLGTERYRRHLDEVRDFYRERRDSFAVALSRHFRDIADWQVPQGGLFFWLRLKTPIDTRTLLDQALAEHVAFMPGEPFFADPEQHRGFLRLNFSHVVPERLDTGLARLATVIRQATPHKEL